MDKNTALLDGITRVQDYLEKHGKTDENGEKWIDMDTAAAIIEGEPGVNSDKKQGYSGKIPPKGIIALEWELAGLVHGTAALTIHVRDGKLARFTTGRERSFMGEAARE